MSTPTVNSLFASAQDEGELSGKSMQALNVPDIGAQIQQGLGITVDDVPASEVVLLTLLIDDSGSIRFSGNEQVVRDGEKAVLDALKDSKQGNNILVHTRLLNGMIIDPFTMLEDATELDKSNYQAVHGTPLYDESVVTLGTVVAKTQEFLDAGVPVRAVTLIITDGSDQHSMRQRADTVKSVVDDMLATERHIIAAMGIDNGSCDFRRIFSEMGILDEWILTPGNTPSEIRNAFQVFSQSAVRASQTAGSFSQTAMGGFGS